MSKTLTNQQKKDWAKMLYMQGELQSRQIAEKVGVSPVTMSKWSREGNWEMLRAAVTTTREEQIRNLYMQIAEMNKAIAERGDKYATSTEADTINKLSAAIAKLEAICMKLQSAIGTATGSENAESSEILSRTTGVQKTVEPSSATLA